MKRLSLIDDINEAPSNCATPTRNPIARIDSSAQEQTALTTQYETWGLEEFDQSYGGLAAGTFNMLATPNNETALVAIGHFLSQGLLSGQRVAFIAMDNPRLTLSRLAIYGFDYETALQTEQLIYLYYTPKFSHALSFSTDYTALFNEIRELTGPISRLAFLNADLLFNLQTEYLARESVSKLAAEADGNATTTLGCYVRQKTHSSSLLDATCNTLMPSYLQLRRKPGQRNLNYTLEWRKGPFNCTPGSNKLALKLGKGYVKRSTTKSQTA